MTQKQFLVGGFIALAVMLLLGVAALKPQTIPLTLPSSPKPFFTQTEAPAPDFQPSTLNLSTLLARDPDWTATLSAERTVTLIATGDVLLARSINRRTVRDQDWLWPFAKTSDVLKSADLTFVNLETPLPNECPIRVDGFTFCGDQRNIEGLLAAGVDIVNLANNHAGNHGTEGVDETEVALKANNLAISGVNGPVYVTVKDKKFAFLGFNEVDLQPGVHLAEYDTVAAQVKEARAHADIVIVQFHWGIEYTYQPSTNQQRLGRLAIDNGADLIIGNHPHWFQPLEFYNGKLITYSHGNFIFDQMWSQETREGVVGKYTFYDNTLVAVEFMPIKIEDYGQPRWLEGEEKEKLLEKFYGEVERFNREKVTK